MIGTVLVSLGLAATCLHPAMRRMPLVATEAQLAAFLETHRRDILKRPPPPSSEEVGLVIELPPRPKVRFLAPPRAVSWFSRGGRFAPDGILTLPNAERPFLFFAQESGGAKPARFALLSPPMVGIAAVTNAIDLPPVTLTRGKDQTVWTGHLTRVGDRYALPEAVGARGLTIADDGFPAPRVGLPAPTELSLDKLPASGILLDQTMLFRVRSRERILRGGPNAVNAVLLRLGIRPLPFLPSEIVSGRMIFYEAWTLIHVYRREGDKWRYSHARAISETATATEGDDATALTGLGYSPVPRTMTHSDGTFANSDPPGRSLLAYGDAEHP